MSQLPKTSHEANVSMTAELRQQHHSKIISALEVLGEAIGEKIAIQANMDYHAVMRRMKELTIMGKIYNTLKTAPTSTGRQANLYAILKSDTILPQPENHYREGVCSAADYASELIAKTKQGKLVQKDLFNN